MCKQWISSSVKSMNILTKIACILIITCWISFIVEGVILESFNYVVFDFKVILYWNLIGVGIALVAKKWKLALIGFIGFFFVYAIVLGLSEFLWWVLLKYFHIDIAYR